MNKTMNMRTLMAVVASICFLMAAGAFSTVAAKDGKCDGAYKDFKKSSVKYQKVLKKAHKLASKKNVDLGKMNAVVKDKKRLEMTLKGSMARIEKNKDTCPKKWKSTEKEMKKIRKLAAKNKKLLAKMKAKNK